MRFVNSIADAQIVIRDLQDRLAKLETKDRDMHGLKLRNAGDAVSPTDYVTLRQLPDLVQTATSTPDQNFLIVFTPPDTLVIDNSLTVYRYIVGQYRVSYPVGVYVYCDVAPTSGPLSVDIMWNGNTAGSVETNLLSTPLVLAQGKNGPVASRSLNKTFKRPVFSYLSTVRPKIVLGGGAAGVTIAVECLRINLGDIKDV